MTISERKSIARLALPALSGRAAKLFRTPEKELKLVSKLRAKIQPKLVVTKSALHGKDRKLGMKFSAVTPGKIFFSFIDLEQEFR